MKTSYLGFKKKLDFFSTTKEPYKKLRKHLNKQPVGYPATPSGVEIRLLKEIFTPVEAEVALNLSYKFEPFESIYARAREMGYDEDRLHNLLESMEKKGCIFVRHSDKQTLYALHPFAIGIFEMQVKRLTPSFFLDSHKYMLQGFAMEYLTSKVPQMRVIPINTSLTATQNIATYDQIRDIVERTEDKIMVTDCICKVGKDLVNNPCKVTDRREVCMGFRDFADAYTRNGWGRSVSKKEALEILDQNEKEGLMLITATMQEPQFVCSCCDCCCGIIEMIKIIPRSVDFAASNFQAELNSETCIGCGKCVERCHMEAIKFDKEAKKATAINHERCVGCGLCVSSCKTESVKLKKKDAEFIPPKDHEALYEVLMQNKRSMAGKMAKMTKAVMGMKI